MSIALAKTSISISISQSITSLRMDVQSPGRNSERCLCSYKGMHAVWRRRRNQTQRLKAPLFHIQFLHTYDNLSLGMLVIKSAGISQSIFIRIRNLTICLWENNLDGYLPFILDSNSFCPVIKLIQTSKIALEVQV